MHYVLVSSDNVITGPIPWNYRMFQSSLEEDLEISGVQLPFNKNDADPIEIDANTRIIPARYADSPSFNPKIEFLQGPYWTIENDEAVGSFVVENLPIGAVKNFLKERVAYTRWKQEVEGIKVTLQGNEYTIDTNRGARDIFLQAVQLNAGGHSWKFPEGWVTLSVNELQTVVDAIMSHVQTKFAWEAQKVAEINAATTLQDLDDIELPDLNPRNDSIE